MLNAEKRFCRFLMNRIIISLMTPCLLIAASLFYPDKALANSASKFITVDGHKEYYKVPSTSKPKISETHYSYKKVAAALTRDCTTDYEKICAINSWISRNIEYDTTYSIRTADECFDKRKGVCQGYCELFYRIAEAAGVNVEIIVGISRSITGEMNSGRHAWIFAYTRPFYGIFVDPTWDAGTVSNNEFKYSEVHGYWFNVDPEWMILNHFPDDESCQLLQQPLTKDEFLSIEYSFSVMYKYGFDAHELLNRALDKTLSIPKIYNGGDTVFKVLDVPIEQELKKGQTYTFRIKKLSGNDIILRADRDYTVSEGEWIYEGDDIYSLAITSTTADSVVLCAVIDDNIYTCIEYGIR